MRYSEFQDALIKTAGGDDENTARVNNATQAVVDYIDQNANSEAMNTISPQEIWWTLGGTGLGAGAAYLLSSAIAPKASLAQRLLHTGIGGAAGGVGANLLLSNMEDSNTGLTWRDSYRAMRDPNVKKLYDQVMSEPASIRATGEERSLASKAAPYVAAGATEAYSIARGMEKGLSQARKLDATSFRTGGKGIGNWGYTKEVGKGGLKGGAKGVIPSAVVGILTELLMNSARNADRNGIRAR